ncbi:PepSY domain-containing protein [Vibrio sinaloensis]|nr:PepSY domain-containing protein [Vibrio sinaloensis]
MVAVNPYTAEVQGAIDRSDSVYELMNSIHGTLLIGELGDRLIEIAASLSILLLVSGLYLWWPKDSASRAGFFKVASDARKARTYARSPCQLGRYSFTRLVVLFLISGLAWAGIWGAKMIQGWNTFPTYYTWGEKPESTMLHKDLNHGASEEVPWNLELAPVPQSQDAPAHDHANMQEAAFTVSHNAISIDEIASKAQALGFTHYKIFLASLRNGCVYRGCELNGGRCD